MERNRILYTDLLRELSNYTNENVEFIFFNNKFYSSISKDVNIEQMLILFNNFEFDLVVDGEKIIGYVINFDNKLTDYYNYYLKKSNEIFVFEKFEFSENYFNEMWDAFVKKISENTILSRNIFYGFNMEYLYIYKDSIIPINLTQFGEFGDGDGINKIVNQDYKKFVTKLFSEG